MLALGVNVVDQFVLTFPPCLWGRVYMYVKRRGRDKGRKKRETECGDYNDEVSEEERVWLGRE